MTGQPTRPSASPMRVDLCTSCGEEFEQERKRGRPRSQCNTCLGRPRADRVGCVTVEPPVKADPPVRADGLCAVCLKPRKISKQTRRYAGHAVDLDPFCSTNCCRRWHGTELDTMDDDDPRVAASRAASRRMREQRGHQLPDDDGPLS